MGIYDECRLCGESVEYFDSASVFGNDAIYTKCLNCKSIQINNPTWLEEAHDDAISLLDTGVVRRSIVAARIISSVLFLQGEKKVSGIDWGGGTGLLTRLLRDCGFDVHSYDLYAAQDLAAGFVTSKKLLSEEKTFFSIVECMEHLEHPLENLREVSENKAYFFLQVETLPNWEVRPSKGNWWYFSQETGQHITFPTNKGLSIFSNSLGFTHHYSIGGMHIFSRSPIKSMTKVILRIPKFRIMLIYFIYEFLSMNTKSTFGDRERLVREI